MRIVAPLFSTRLTAVAAQCVAMAVISLSSFSVRADEVADVQKLLSAGKNVEAMQKADQFLSSKPKDPMMRFLRGISLSQAGRTAEAVTAFQKLTEDYPELPEPFNNLAVLYAQQGQYDKSRTALEMAIRTNPSYATAYENLGDVYAKLASQAYSKALQIDTRSAVAPKLAMIRDLFPKDRNAIAVAANTGTKPTTSVPVTTPTVPVASTPAVTPVVKPPVVTPPTIPVVTPPPVASNEAQQAKAVETALRAWAAAWSAKDVDGYLEAYADDFKGDKGSHKAWAQERRERIVSKNKISVNLSGIDVTVNGNKATARFRQAYKADSLDISSGKRVDFIRVGNDWLIVRESSGS